MNNTTLKIFVVDDSSFCRQLYIQHLKNLGFSKVFAYENGIECINEIGIQPDVIFLDFDMQPINGAEVLLSLKHIYPHIEFVFISSESDPTIVDRVMKAGAYGFIPKGENDLERMENMILKIVEQNSPVVVKN